jgi:hypothetical protein
MWPSVAASQECAECGWAASGLGDEGLVRLIGAEGPAWSVVLADAPLDGLRWRPDPEVWSGLEYAAHSRGVLEVFGGRVQRMLAEEHPEMPEWDDEGAITAEVYNEQDPADVRAGIEAAAAAYAEVLRGVNGEAWQRTGTRPGMVWSVSSISWYGLHESVHHRFDVERSLQHAPR